MASSVLTNGATSLLFREGDLQIPIKTPKTKIQRLIRNSARLPTVQTISDETEQILTVELALFREDQGSYAGADSLISFYESSDPTGVNGLAQTFMLTDSDGDSYQVRFLDNLAGGLREVKKDSMFVGTTRLLVEPSLPTDYATGPLLWVAAYDMDNNGGDLSNWTTTDPVGGVGAEWSDKSGNGYDGDNAANPAEWLTSQINSRPAIDFVPGSFEYLFFRDGSNGPHDSFDGNNDNPWSVYIVLKPDVADTNRVVFGVESGGGVDDHIIFLEQTSTGTGEWGAQIDDNVASPRNAAGGQPTTSGHIISAVCDGTDVWMYDQGTNIVDEVSLGVNVIDVTSTRVGYSIPNGTGGYYDGKVAEIVLFYATHTTQQRRRQQRRLADMWGITLTG